MQVPYANLEAITLSEAQKNITGDRSAAEEADIDAPKSEGKSSPFGMIRLNTD